jgi:hypothetical protein
MTMKIAVLTNCTSSSSVPVVPYLDGVAMGNGYSHTSAGEEWKKRIDRAFAQKDGLCRVKQLYTGISFRTMLQAMDHLGDVDSNLFIVSLGFGLVKAEDIIASYNLNMQESDQSASSLLNIVTEELFEPIRWWNAVNRNVHGPESPVANLITSNDYDLIIIALTNNFLHLAAADIASCCTTEAFNKVRIVGPKGNNWMLKYMRHIAKRGVIMPYGPTLNDMIPGNRLDFAQRAALHFIQKILVPSEYSTDLNLHKKMVGEIFGGRDSTGGTYDEDDVKARIEVLKVEHLNITDAYTALIKQGVQIRLDKFQRLWGMQQVQETSESDIDDAMAALNTIGIVQGYDDQSEVIQTLRTFTNALRSRGGGKFTVGDVCDWAKIYYDRRQKKLPLTLQSRPKLGRLLPSLVGELRIIKTVNSIGAKIYEVLPESASQVVEGTGVSL